jgi:hypothetical protein
MEQSGKKNSGTRLFAILSLIFFGLACFLGYQLYNQKVKTQTIIIEREKASSDYENVKSELGEVQKAYEGLQTNNKELQDQLDTRKAELADLETKLEKAKGNEYEISKLKRELKTIRDLIKSYLHDIDSLNILNQGLRTENQKVKEDLTAEQTKNTELSNEKKKLSETVEIGSRLKANSIKIEGIKSKSGDKESVVTKAKRTDKIKTCFIFGENSIAKKEEKQVFVKITGPDGKVLAHNLDDDTFVVNGERLNYSAKKEVNYEGRDKDVCIYFTKNEDFLPGKYKIEIYCDGGLAGSGTVELR